MLHAEFPSKINTEPETRLYKVSLVWNDKQQNTIQKDFIISADSSDTATQIAQNHLPPKLKIKKDKNEIVQDVEIHTHIMDYGRPDSNITYYESPAYNGSLTGLKQTPVNVYLPDDNSHPENLPTSSEEQTQEEPIPSEENTTENNSQEFDEKLLSLPKNVIQIMIYATYFGIKLGRDLEKTKTSQLPKPVRNKLKQLLGEEKKLPNLTIRWANDYINQMEEQKISPDIFYEKKLSNFIDHQMTQFLYPQTNHSSNPNNTPNKEE